MIRRPVLRAVACAGVVLGTAPALVAATTLRASADAPPFGQFALTAVVRASSTGGDVGASGGLTPLDSGSASVDAALDSSPTSMALARPVEPGTTFATVDSQVPPGTPVPALPEAAAAYPGTTPTASATGATAAVTPTSATGSATAGTGAQAGLTLGATTASATLGSAGGGNAVTAVADAYAAGFDVAGVLSVRGVRGHAEVGATAGGTRTATATLTVASAAVAGIPVSIDDSGVHAIGSSAPLAPTLAQLNAAVNAALTAGGLSISLAQPIHTTGSTALGNDAAADSGGLSITVTTPDTTVPVPGSLPVPGDLPPNVATVTLGRVQLTEADQAAVDDGTPIADTSGTVPPDDTGSVGAPALPGAAGTVVTTGGGGTQAPQLAPAARTVRIAGRRVSTRGAIAALGGWQAITLGLATYAVLALRTRPEDEEELLCPCPT